MADFEKKVYMWLADERSTVGRLWDHMRFIWFNKTPRTFRIFGLTHWLVRFSLTASAPALAYFVYNSVTFLQATIAIAALLLVHGLSTGLDTWSKSRNGIADLAAAEIWVRVGDLVSSVKSGATPATNRDQSIQSALGIIEGYARLITKSPKGKVSVNLALYDGSSKTKMSIKHRNPGNERPVGRKLKNLERVLGHRACQAGPEPRVVADLKRFGKEGYVSPTQSSFNYRSICLIPVTSARNGHIKGFLSVDCTVPHAFHGNRADKLVVTCEPLIDHIQHQI